MLTGSCSGSLWRSIFMAWSSMFHSWKSRGFPFRPVSPFEYQFVFVPFVDNGVYEYREPWSGFSVNKDAPDFDYAVEFILFLATEPELNRIAEIKGVPFATKTPSAGVYSGVANDTNA